MPLMTPHESTDQKILVGNRKKRRSQVEADHHARTAAKNAGCKTCSVETCGRKAVARGLCAPHWKRWRAFGDTQDSKPIGDRSGKFNSRWKGGSTFTKNGRVMIYKPDYPGPKVGRAYVLRYRLVMEAHIGRYLRADEIIHHKNGDPTDDRIENLEIMSNVQHAKHHSGELRRSGKWAYKYDQCVECGKTDNEHDAHGLCHRCYARKGRLKKTQARHAKKAN